MTPGFVIAGTHSGVGKTTATAAILAALVRRRLRVQAFKIGPDFIDPGYHRLVTGRASINLDHWMMGDRGIRDSYARYGEHADICILEGMGALFDGENGTSDRGSAAHVARLLGLGVILVVDIWGMTRSTRALLDGFERFDPRVRIERIVLNRAGSARHAGMVRSGLSAPQRRRCLGYLPASADLGVPERHLGMLTVEENPRVKTFREALDGLTAGTLDVAPLVRRVTRGGTTTSRSRAEPAKTRTRIGVARDRAFCFYYEENLDRLRAAGAELVPFSPLADARLPSGLGGLYLGGGYPESFASELAGNAGLREDLRSEAASGMPIYAECGGMMYLANELQTADGTRHRMASVLPGRVVMDPKHLAIRYVAVETRRPSLLGPTGTRFKGQEFHQSRLEGRATATPIFGVRDSYGRASRTGFAVGNAVGSYVHVHFASSKPLARRFVDACAAWSRAQEPVRRGRASS